MSCKNCNKKNTNLVSGLLGNPRERLSKNDMKLSLWNDSLGSSSTGEKVVLILFAWIPLIVGYYTVIKFIISLF